MLREAVFNGISEGDVKEIVQNLVQRAKDGDPQAVRSVFEYVLGGRNAPESITQNLRGCHERRLNIQ